MVLELKIPVGATWQALRPQAPVFLAYVLSFVNLGIYWNNPRLAQAIGRDLKGKLSIAFYAAAVGLAFVNVWLADGLYVLVALMWLVPDLRIESHLLD